MRLEAHIRKKQLLWAAIKLARVHGYRSVTRRAVATAAGCSTNLVTHHFGSQSEFQNEIMREAVATPDLVVLTQGLIARDRIAMNAPSKLKIQAIRSLIK